MSVKAKMKFLKNQLSKICEAASNSSWKTELKAHFMSMYMQKVQKANGKYILQRDFM